jgi:hypothetical protein
LILIHPTSEKRNSRNFAVTEFSEVHRYGVLRSSQKAVSR